MPRHMTGARSAGAGSASLPVGSLYGVATSGLRLVEVGAFNTTNTSCTIGLCRMSTAGTPGAGLTEADYNPGLAPALATGFNTHTVAPTLTDAGYRAKLGAADGSGIVWTFGDGGIVVPAGTANGIGIYVPIGTGQVLDFYFVWDE